MTIIDNTNQPQLINWDKVNWHAVLVYGDISGPCFVLHDSLPDKYVIGKWPNNYDLKAQRFSTNGIPTNGIPCRVQNGIIAPGFQHTYVMARELTDLISKGKATPETCRIFNLHYHLRADYKRPSQIIPNAKGILIDAAGRMDCDKVRTELKILKDLCITKGEVLKTAHQPKPSFIKRCIANIIPKRNSVVDKEIDQAERNVIYVASIFAINRHLSHTYSRLN